MAQWVHLDSLDNRLRVYRDRAWGIERVVPSPRPLPQAVTQAEATPVWAPLAPEAQLRQPASLLGHLDPADSGLEQEEVREVHQNWVASQTAYGHRHVS